MTGHRQNRAHARTKPATRNPGLVRVDTTRAFLDGLAGRCDKTAGVGA